MEEAKPPPDEPKVGDVLGGKYRLDRVIGEGGMGTVFAAHHEILDQTVAVKILAPELARSPEICERFLREARSSAKLQSEHVARVMDAGTGPNGLPFFVMERLEGCDLGELMRRGGPPVSATEAADYGLEALEGLAHAHRAGIVHRDVKPGNLFLATRPAAASVIKVLDFGISKATSGSVGKAFRTLTGGHQIIGSPGYMSPEQVRDPSAVDARTDLWSLGVVLYELVSGQHCFDGEGAMKIFSAILEKDPRPLEDIRKDLPPGFAATIMRAIVRDRDARYRDAGEFARGLAAFASVRALPLVERIEQLAPGNTPKPAELASPAAARSATLATVVAGEARGDEEDVPAGVPRRRPLALLVIAFAVLALGVYLGLARRSLPEPARGAEAGGATDTRADASAPAAARTSPPSSILHSTALVPTLRPKPPKPHK